MKILFLGHSLVEYFDWQRRFPDHRIVNLGVAGETTSGLLERIDAIAAVHRDPDAVLVMSGINDLLLGDEGVMETLGRIATKLRRHYASARIVLMSVLPVSPQWASPERIARFNERIAVVAEESGIEFLDLTATLADEKGISRPGVLLADGVHLGEEGYRRWSRALEDLLTADI